MRQMWKVFLSSLTLEQAHETTFRNQTICLHGVWLEVPTEIQFEEAHDDTQARATVQGQRWLRRLKRKEGPPTDKTEHPMLALRGQSPRDPKKRKHQRKRSQKKPKSNSI